MLLGLRQRQRNQLCLIHRAGGEHDVLLALVHERHRHRAVRLRDLHRTDKLAGGLVERIKLWTWPGGSAGAAAATPSTPAASTAAAARSIDEQRPGGDD